MHKVRRSISQRVRFEVLKRDGFACVYCGARAPGAVLHIDHIEPFSKGGPDELSNYATACQPCNAGKRDSIVLFDQVAELDYPEDSEEAEILNWIWAAAFANKEGYLYEVQLLRKAEPLPEDAGGAEWAEWGYDTARRGALYYADALREWIIGGLEEMP